MSIVDPTNDDVKGAANQILYLSLSKILTSISCATINAVPDIAVGDIVTANVLGYINIDISDVVSVDIGNAKLWSIGYRGGDGDASANLQEAMPIFLQAAEGSTSVYFSIVTSANTWGASDLEFHFNIEY